MLVKVTKFDNGIENTSPLWYTKANSKKTEKPMQENGFFKKLKRKFFRFCKNIWKECKSWQTFVILLIVMAVFYSPVWIGYGLYFLFGFTWCLAVATGWILFWAGPFTPFFPICLALALGIKRFIDRKKEKAEAAAKDMENEAVTEMKKP